MAKFREQSEREGSSIQTIINGCPICRSDVKGNETYLYFCKSCNILFRREDLVISKESINNLVKEKIVEKFSKEYNLLKIEEKLPEPELSDKHKKVLESYEKEKKYFVSKQSNVIHEINCPYGKNIKKENRITLRTVEGTKYKKCKCIIEQ